jgi:hypothetical protein
MPTITSVPFLRAELVRNVRLSMEAAFSDPSFVNSLRTYDEHQKTKGRIDTVIISRE